MALVVIGSDVNSSFLPCGLDGVGVAQRLHGNGAASRLWLRSGCGNILPLTFLFECASGGKKKPHGRGGRAWRCMVVQESRKAGKAAWGGQTAAWGRQSKRKKKKKPGLRV